MLTFKALANTVVLLVMVGASTVTVATTNPATANYTVSAFAVGDWGSTTAKLLGQEVVGMLMDQQAATSKPKAVLGHGDSFYWTGIDSLESRDARFHATYEAKYPGANIKNVTWVNVMGNHDYGGANYICNVGDRLTTASTPVAAHVSTHFAGSHGGDTVVIDLALPFGWTGSPAYYGLFGGAISFLVSRESPHSLDPKETDTEPFFSYVWVDDHLLVEIEREHR
ncbi:hypothetical protein PHYSODRAFT_246219 [Phytophthora sojae]|uniref:Calcineurin-like phosphoesterase domain-containing protein n=1 Tax=Phytophthora sojae (strain P6497) TaxID=1094619 RepID=G4YGE9_PHYSP|nr:hypothetical protein PHYSODRAFT_246219 [Phytophthora sojae]EGZ29062.1 hypothetical protein PHYSODRAFT_246219 [Phytophthora sojae]|eukprot:XP_009516337.1 hypothetical protein PHYSODRAFT_246219 [Phytophthora sojae]